MKLCHHGDMRMKIKTVDSKRQDGRQKNGTILKQGVPLTINTNLHSWGSRTGRLLWGTTAHREAETSSLVAQTTAANRTGHQMEWKEPACEINTDCLYWIHQRRVSHSLQQFKVKCVLNTAPPTNHGVSLPMGVHLLRLTRYPTRGSVTASQAWLTNKIMET